jgi:hypothetical protein
LKTNRWTGGLSYGVVQDIKLIMPTVLILLFTIFIMVTVIPYAFSSGMTNISMTTKHGPNLSFMPLLTVQLQIYIIRQKLQHCSKGLPAGV